MQLETTIICDELPGKRRPFIKELFNYSIDTTLNEGTIEFDGYYYINDPSDEKNDWDSQNNDDLPTQLLMNVFICETEPTYKQVAHNCFHIEVYKRFIIQNTDVISKEIDEDGEEMNICFFPTNRQRLHFKILKYVNSAEDIPESFR